MKRKVLSLMLAGLVMCVESFGSTAPQRLRAASPQMADVMALVERGEVEQALVLVNQTALEVGGWGTRAG